MFDWSSIQYRLDGKILLLYRHERIFEEGLVNRGDRAIDVGGWGVLAARLHQEGVDCTIIDLFTEDQYYAERVRSSNYREADICDWASVQDLAPVQLVTCFEMLEHCHDQPRALYNMYKLLSSGGVVVGTIPIPGHSHAADDQGVCFISKDEMVRMLSAAGFIDVVVEPTGSIHKGDTPCSLYFKALKK